MKILINRILLLGISLFFTIYGFLFLDKTNITQILLLIISTIISIFLIIDIIQEIRIIKHPSAKRNHVFIRTIIAICLIVLSVTFLIKVVDNTIYQISNQSIEAIITNVEYHAYEKQDYIGDEYQRKRYKTTCTTKIAYTINNQEYNNYLDTDQCIFKEKNKVTIYYNKNNPKEIRSIPVILLPLFLSILSILVTIIYIITIRKIKINIEE